MKCVGCGYCCAVSRSRCEVSTYLHPNTDAEDNSCPELLFSDNRYWCKWVIAMDLLGDMDSGVGRTSIGVDTGCIEPDNPWRNNIKDRELGPRPVVDSGPVLAGVVFSWGK